MHSSGRSILGRTLVLFLIGFSALCIIVGTATWLFVRTTTYTASIVSIREARATLVDLKSLVQDAETGQRGFLLTGRDSYLVPFERARAEIPQRLDQLRQSAAVLPELHGQLDELDPAIRQKLDELSQTIDLARQGRRDEVLRIIDSDRGKILMDQIRQRFDQLTQAADHGFAAAVDRQRETASLLRWVAFLGALVILAVVGGATLTVMRHTRALASARAEIERLNQGLEARIRERTRDLARANEEVQRFAYIVTHDLRAPLVNIMGFTSELEASLPPLQQLVADAEAEGRDVTEARLSAHEDLPEAINFIRSSTRKMDGLINAILKLSRQGRRQLVPEAIALEPMFQAAVDALRHQMEESDARVDLEVQVPNIVSDRVALGQVIGNLLDNAVKYARPDVPLRVAMRARRAAPGWVDIEVEDNGRGIAEQDHERVFELFRRAGTQDKPGEGLGLAHVRAFVRGLGGDITLTSRLGEGTTFRVTLPIDLRAAIRSNDE